MNEKEGPEIIVDRLDGYLCAREQMKITPSAWRELESAREMLISAIVEAMNAKH